MSESKEMKAKKVAPRINLPQGKDAVGSRIGAVGSRIGDTSDLPNALVNQLRRNRGLSVAQKIEHVLRERFGGVASVDEIMVALYRDFEYITTNRPSLVSRLHQMVNANLLVREPNRFGVFSLSGNNDTDGLVGRK